MNQKQFLSWIKNNSQWIISKLENLNDYKNNNKDLEVGDIVMWGAFRNPERFYVSLIDSINIYDKSSKQEWVSYFQQDLYLKRAKNTGSSKDMLVFTLINYEQPYEHLKKDYLFEMLEHQEYVVGNISETIKKPFLNWSQKTPWKKSSSDQ
jgi:hypothetical protein